MKKVLADMEVEQRHEVGRATYCGFDKPLGGHQ